MDSEMHAIESTGKSRAQTVAADVLATVRGATHAMEAEATAMIDLERAYQKANDAAASLRRAIKADVAARAATVLARNRTKKPLREDAKAARIAAKADQLEERKTATLRAKQERLAKDQTIGKQPDPAAVEKVKLRAEQAGSEARAAHLALEKARQASELAMAAVASAQEQAKVAADRLRSARIDDAGAKREVEKAEENAKKAIEGARVAVLTETGAKRALDKAITALKAIMLQEARASEAAATEKASAKNEDQPGPRSIVGQPVGKLKALTSSVTKKAGHLSRLRHRAPQDLAEIAAIPKGEMQPAESPAEGEHEAYSGVLRLLIIDPADHADVVELQRGIERMDGVRVTSVAGSSDRGTCITVAASQPVPLALQLGQMEVVDKVLKRGKDLEVRLRLPESRPAASSTSVPASSVVR